MVLKKWKDGPCSWTEWPNIIKMSCLFKLIYKFKAIPTKIPKRFFFFKLRKFIWKNKHVTEVKKNCKKVPSRKLA